MEGQTGKILYVLIPCFNEEEVLKETAEELEKVMKSMIRTGLIAPQSRVVFIDDGSADHTWERIRQQTEKDSLFGGLALRTNTGHQNALYAGIMAVKDLCHMTVSMDADLQDDPSILPDMVKLFYEGNEVVYGIRKSRAGDGFLKKMTAGLFYRLMGAMGTGIPRQCGDFRLMGREAMECLACFNEDRPFLRGLIPGMNFPSSYVSFDRRKRRAGTSKYTPGRMLRFAFDGICSMSAKPLSLILALGGLIFAGSAFWLLLHLTAPPDLTTVMAIIWAVGGLIIFSIGLVGQYVGRIWQEQLGRPRYFIKESRNLGDGTTGKGAPDPQKE